MVVRSNGAASFAATARIGSRSRAESGRTSDTALIASMLPPRSGAHHSKYSSLAGADRVEAARAPADHAAGEVRDFPEPEALQDHDRLRRARAGAAHGDDGAFAVELGGAPRELAQRHEARAVDMAEWSRPFVRLAHVDDLHARDVLLERGRLHLVDAGEGERKG